MLFYGTTYLWQSDLVSHSAPSSENFVHTLKQLNRIDCDRILLWREKQTMRFSSDCHCNDWSFEIYFMHPYNSAQSFRLLVRVTFLFFSLSLTVLYKISIGCFRFLFQYWSYELIKCSTALFAGCILIMSIWVIYACVHLALWTRYDVCENSHV